jgi:hypothetical protein
MPSCAPTRSPTNVLGWSRSDIPLRSFGHAGGRRGRPATVTQKGSSESKQEAEDPHDEDPRRHRDDPDAPWPVRRGGWWLRKYENSLLIAFVGLFLGSMVGHALGGVSEYSSEQVAHAQPAVSASEFVRTRQFWFESFQNWRSEFLAVGSIVALTIVLRQRGSPESKPVHEPVDATGG